MVELRGVESELVERRVERRGRGGNDSDEGRPWSARVSGKLRRANDTYSQAYGRRECEASGFDAVLVVDDATSGDDGALDLDPLLASPEESAVCARV